MIKLITKVYQLQQVDWDQESLRPKDLIQTIPGPAFTTIEKAKAAGEKWAQDLLDDYVVETAEPEVPLDTDEQIEEHLKANRRLLADSYANYPNDSVPILPGWNDNGMGPMLYVEYSPNSGFWIAINEVQLDPLDE